MFELNLPNVLMLRRSWEEITIVSGADYFFGFRSLIQARRTRHARG